MWWFNLLAEVLRSVSLRKNVRPAGKIMHANESLTIRDGNSYFVPFILCNEDNSCNNTCFLSEVMHASIEVVLKCMPKNTSKVVGPSTLDGLTGTLSFSHNANMA